MKNKRDNFSSKQETNAATNILTEASEDYKSPEAKLKLHKKFQDLALTNLPFNSQLNHFQNGFKQKIKH